MVHIKEPLLLIGKSSLCGGSGFPFSLSDWSLTICLTPYNRKFKNVLSASLNKTFPSSLTFYSTSSSYCSFSVFLLQSTYFQLILRLLFYFRLLLSSSSFVFFFFVIVVIFFVSDSESIMDIPSPLQI